MRRDRYGNISGRKITNNVGLLAPAMTVLSTTSYGAKTISSKKGNTMAIHKGSRRDRLRGRGQIRYHNPLLTQDRVRQVFGFHTEYDYDDYEVAEASPYDYTHSPTEDENVYIGYQYELPLTNVDTLEGEHRKMITKYQRAIEIMGAQALLWEDLMSDLEDHPHLKTQFEQFQMLRKLSGGRL